MLEPTSFIFSMYVFVVTAWRRAILGLLRTKVIMFLHVEATLGAENENLLGWVLWFIAQKV